MPLNVWLNANKFTNVKKFNLFVIVIICVTVIAIVRLYRHTASEPFSFELIFSKENVIEVVMINAVAAVILTIGLWLWKK